MTPRTPSRITIIFNPVAGNRRRGLLDRVVDRLSEKGWQVSVVGTTGPGNATALAAQAAAAGAGVVGAAGGDGTIREVIPGIPADGPPVAIIPLGTANVLALELGIGKSAAAIAETVSNGRRRRLHLPTANGNPFCLMTGAGFDGEIVHAVTWRMKRRLGRAAFAFQGLRAIVRFTRPRVRVTCDGRTLTGIWAVATNISRYGGAFRLDPLSRPEAAEIAAFVFTGGSRFRLCCDLVRLGLGRVEGSPTVAVLRGREILFESATGGPCPVQIDGDPAAPLPAAIRATDRHIDILTPAPD